MVALKAVASHRSKYSSDGYEREALHVEPRGDRDDSGASAVGCLRVVPLRPRNAISRPTLSSCDKQEVYRHCEFDCQNGHC